MAFGKTGHGRAGVAEQDPTGAVTVEQGSDEAIRWQGVQAQCLQPLPILRCQGLAVQQPPGHPFAHVHLAPGRAPDGVGPGVGVSRVARVEPGQLREVERVVGREAADPRKTTDVDGEAHL